MYYLGTGHHQHFNFRNAVLAALAVHAALIFGVSFEASRAAHQSRQIEVTLATRPATAAPDEARHLAQANQLGSGELDDISRISASEIYPAAAVGERAPPRRQDAEALRRDAVTTSAISERLVHREEAALEPDAPRVDGINPEVDRLNRELASLQAELDRQTLAYSEQPRVRRLTAAAAKQSADAAYLLDWRRRLEAVGNQFYPEASARYGIYGDLRLLVVIRHDGSLEDVRILSSSGYAVLDEAAIRIVRMAAPYAPFPPELRATTDKLEIVRTWQFRENELSSGQGLP